MKFSLTDFIIIISKTAFCICNISICPSFGELPYRKMYSKVNGSVSKCKATELKGTRGLSHFDGIYIGGAVSDSTGSFVTALMRLDLHYIWLPT